MVSWWVRYNTWLSLVLTLPSLSINRVSQFSSAIWGGSWCSIADLPLTLLLSLVRALSLGWPKSNPQCLIPPLSWVSISCHYYSWLIGLRHNFFVIYMYIWRNLPFYSVTTFLSYLSLAMHVPSILKSITTLLVKRSCAMMYQLTLCRLKTRLLICSPIPSTQTLLFFTWQAHVLSPMSSRECIRCISILPNYCYTIRLD